jgi:hypothetical protein
MFKSIKMWVVIIILTAGTTAIGAQIYKYKSAIAAAEAKLAIVKDKLSRAETKVLESEGFVIEQNITIQELSAENISKDDRFVNIVQRHNNVISDIQKRLNDAEAPNPDTIIAGEKTEDDKVIIVDSQTGVSCKADVTVTGDCIFTLVPNINNELHAKGSWYAKVEDRATGNMILEKSMDLSKASLYKLPKPEEKEPTIKEKLHWYAGAGYGIAAGGEARAVIAGREFKAPIIGKWLVLGSYEQITFEGKYCIDQGSLGCSAYGISSSSLNSFKLWGLKRF